MQSAEIINFAVWETAAEQEVIREFNEINWIIVHDIDGDSGSQISTGDVSQQAQCGEIDAAQ